MNTADDRQERVRPSGRNGNRLPLRRRGERIGGRQKGTPNKMPLELQEAIIAAAVKIAKHGAGRKWFPTGEDALQNYLEGLAVRSPSAFCQLLIRVMQIQEKSRKREWAGQRERIQEMHKRLSQTVET